MSNESKKKKLLLGSALAGLMVAGPGLSVTVGSSGQYFQTSELSVGYRLAQAEEEEAKEAPAEGDQEKAAEGEEKPKEEAKKGGSGSCGAGSCG